MTAIRDIRRHYRSSCPWLIPKSTSRWIFDSVIFIKRFFNNNFFSIKLKPGTHSFTSHDSTEADQNLSFDVTVQGGELYFRGIQEWGINCAPPDQFELKEDAYMENYRSLSLKQVHARQPLEILPNREFESALAYYNSANPKPAIPEEVRGLQIQAEAAIRENNYEEAEHHFSDAIKLSPWWANGYYNHALILKELNEYTLAIEEMKRYLALNPNATDARGIKDMIYLWQRKANQ